MSVPIYSAVPRAYLTGINDKGRAAVNREPEALPTHLAMVYGFASTGPTGYPELVQGATRTGTFGTDSFTEGSPYFTHAAVLSNTLNAQGNMQMFQRVKPSDAGPNATLRLYFDALATAIPLYQRNSDGSIKRDDDGNPIPTGTTTPGIDGKWIVEEVPDTDEGGFSLATEKPGVQNDGVAQSVKYPFFDLEVPFFGKEGALNGLRMWAKTQNGQYPLDSRLLTDQGVFPFEMAVLRRPDEQTTGRVRQTIGGAESVTVTFPPATADRNTGVELYLADRFIQEYQDLDDPSSAPIYGPFGKMHVYDASVKKVLDLVWNKEKAHIDEFSDIAGLDIEKERYLINLLSAQSSVGVPYQTLRLSFTGPDTVRMSENSVFYARGGSDGTMNETVLAELVKIEMEEWANPLSPLQNTIAYPVSIMYDSGYPLATKYAMANFISLRKDTAVVLAVHDVLGRVLTASEESSIAQSLRTHLRLFPESEIHGTHVCRGAIVGRSGILLGSKYRRHLPLSIELASKAADYMGAANGRWKPGRSFDSAPLNEITMFKDINITWTPDTVRNKDWLNCLIWSQSFTRKTSIWPGLKTVYDDDTSTLNSFFTMMIFVDLEKVGVRSWLQFVGSDRRDQPVLKRDVEKFINDAVKDKYDGRALIIPEVYFTEADKQRNYSWSTRVRVGTAGMYTANTIELQAYRIAELQALAG